MSKGDWRFRRSSGFPGFSCNKCACWVHEDYELVCHCDEVKTEVPKDRWVEPKPVLVSAREQGLDDCIGNYEEAIGMVLARATAAEKEAKEAKKQLAKLVKVVMHSTKKPMLLLEQAGITL